jgi:uncharacterized protein YjbI with pentapeptide repeats
MGKVALSVDLGGGPLYIAVDLSAGMPIPVLTSTDSDGAALSVYEVIGSNPRSIVLQSNFVSDDTRDPDSTFLSFTAGAPDDSDTYTPAPGLVHLSSMPALGSDLTLAVEQTQLLLLDIDASLMVVDGTPPHFAARRGSDPAAGTWHVRTILAAGASWNDADLRNLQYGWPLGDKSAQRARLGKANMSGASFARCDFTGADFTAARLRLTTWSGKHEYCTLDGATLHRANLAGAQFQYCSLAGANLRNAVCNKFTSFAHANLTGADFSGVDLSGVDFTGASLSGANLTGAILRGANLTDAVMDEAMFPAGGDGPEPSAT